LIFETGRFALHLLRTDQYDLIHQLGFQSGRAMEKLARVPHRPGTTGVPILEECYAHFECRVVNAMDTGSSTCFLGDVVAVGFGAATAPQGAVMTAAYFREHLPAAWRPEYERHLQAAQDHARATSRDIAPLTWTRR
jgi:flavin reductase (DIM6/NTAB) family NADH-FMN oxidoreductase RutF